MLAGLSKDLTRIKTDDGADERGFLNILSAFICVIGFLIGVRFSFLYTATEWVSRSRLRPGGPVKALASRPACLLRRRQLRFEVFDLGFRIWEHVAVPAFLIR